MPDLTVPIFTDETKAREYLASVRWPDGPFCPFCGQLETVRALPAKGSMGAPWYHCRECRKHMPLRLAESLFNGLTSNGACVRLHTGSLI